MNAGEKLKERRDAERAERRRQERLDERAQERADREQEEQRAEERRQQAAQEEAAWRDAEDRERERRQQRFAQLRHTRLASQRASARSSRRHDLLRAQRRAEDQQAATEERRREQSRANRRAGGQQEQAEQRASDRRDEQRASDRRRRRAGDRREQAREDERQAELLAETREARLRAHAELRAAAEAAAGRGDEARRAEAERRAQARRQEQAAEARRRELRAEAREARLRAQADERAAAEAAAERAVEARRAEAERRAQARWQEQAAEERRRELQAAAAAARRAELAEPEPLELPWLRTEDNQVVAWGGEPVVLRGVSATGLGSAAGPLPAALALGDDGIADLSERWGANAVRLPFAAAALLAGGEPLLQQLDDLVASLAQTGIYTLLAQEDAPSAQLWTLLADRYQGAPSVLFEPGDASLELVRAIRGRHASSLLLLPANGLEALPIHNVLYVLPRVSLPEVGLAALVSRLPLLVTAWSETGFDAGTVTANLLARVGVGWAADGWNGTPPLAGSRFGLAVRRALATPTRPALTAFP